MTAFTPLFLSSVWQWKGKGQRNDSIENRTWNSFSLFHNLFDVEQCQECNLKSKRHVAEAKHNLKQPKLEFKYTQVIQTLESI